MTDSPIHSPETLSERLRRRFADELVSCDLALGELTAEVAPGRLMAVCRALHDEPEFSFKLLIDLCGVDYLDYGDGSRGGPRYAVVYHLLSIDHNQRLRLRVRLDDEYPRVSSVIEVWASANWYEREAFDLFGILFDGHPDLRRILTDYGFIGHPFRKDFPLSGNVEMRYDPEKKRVIYEPVSIEPRINIPKVIRHDHRYLVRNGTARENG
ncbi:MAG: NADH-quinone oxidoreductase subunit C [Gammaproteobacteria bacterium]|nr:NADH-quinone oxidoreductase subunit C [Gammaproteobacteria bacterium]